MGTWLAFAAFMEQCLADNAAERPQLERVAVVAKWALCWHHTGIGALILSMASTSLVLATVILAGDRANTTYALVRFCRAYSGTALVGFCRAYATTSGSSSKRAERAHDYSMVVPAGTRFSCAPDAAPKSPRSPRPPHAPPPRAEKQGPPSAAAGRASADAFGPPRTSAATAATACVLSPEEAEGARGLWTAIRSGRRGSGRGEVARGERRRREFEIDATRWAVFRGPGEA